MSGEVESVDGGSESGGGLMTIEAELILETRAV